MKLFSCIVVIIVIALGCMLFEVHSTSAASSTLANVVASMQPGTWAQLSTNNINPTLSSTGASGIIFGYAEYIKWDSVGQRLYYMGSDHNNTSGTIYAEHVQYDATTNAWSRLPQQSWAAQGPGSAKHGYDHGAIDPVHRYFYFRPFADRVIHRYNMDTGGWTSMAANNVTPNNAAAVGIEYFPELQGVIWVGDESDYFAGVTRLNDSTGQWDRLGQAAAYPMGGYHNFAEYNPVYKVVVFGGGVSVGASGGIGPRKMYKLSSNGTVTALKDAPVNLGVQDSIFTVDSASGDYLVFTTDSKFYVYNVVTDTWTLRASGSSVPIWTSVYGNPLHGVVGGPIDTYGVNVFVTCDGSNNCKVNLYKHSSGSTPITPSFDYSVSNGGNKTVTQGSSATNVITSTLVSGTTQPVTFSASGLPTGATASFSAAACSPSCSPTLTLTTATSTPSGTYTISVTATGGVNHTSSFSLTVNNASTPGPPPSSLTFAGKCAQTGVLRCIDFDNVNQIFYGWPGNHDFTSSSACDNDPFLKTQTWNSISRNRSGPGNVYATIQNNQCVYPVIDNSTTHSGAGSLKFTIGSNTSADSSGYFTEPFQRLSNGTFAYIAPGSPLGNVVYMQFYQRFDPNFISTAYRCLGGGCGGWKQELMYGNPPNGTSSSNIEVTMNNGWLRGVPQLYGQSGTDYYGIQDTRGCTDTTSGFPEPPCLRYKANQWMEFTVRIEVRGTSNAPQSRVQLWLDGQLAVDYPNAKIAWGSSDGDGIGQVMFTPYHTNKDPGQSHPVGYTWYDDLIVSTQPIAMANGSTPPPSSDTTPPTVSMSAPTSGSSASGSSVSVSATASDNTGVVGVQFTLDGANLGSEKTAAPYSVSWNTTTVTNGSHTLRAIARDAAGNSTTSAPVTVTVNNTPDTTPPAVSISGPSNGTTVSGILSVAATASDNVAVAGVQFKLDGANLGTELTAGPWAVQWNTPTAINGAHTLTAVVRDAAGNTATASPVTVQVSNAPGSVISTFVQSMGLSNNANGANIAAAFNAATNAGNLIVAAVSWGDPSSLTCSDSQGNVYTTVTTQYDTTNNQSLGICYAPNTKGGTDTVTAVFSGTPRYRRILIHEYSGILASNPVDAMAKNISTATTAANSATSSTANTSSTDLIFGAVMNDSGNLLNIQAGTNFVLRGSLNGMDLATEDQMPVAPGSIAATWTFGAADLYLAQVVAFKLASTPAPQPDTTRPTVSVTAPMSGGTVSSTINVSANASDNVGVVGVQFKLDGANLGAEVTSQPYSILWDTTAAANGSHTLTAAARDAAGNQAASSPVSFTVNNAAPDTVPPAVSLTNPADGSTVSATIAVSAMASDNVGVVGVQFQLDGANLGAEVTVAPYSTSLNTTTVTDGTHTLTAVARDAAGNPTTSAAVSVTVGNNATPTVSILTPTINSALSSTVPVSATASNSAGIAGVQFQVDGANWGAEVTSPPYKMSWNTSKVSNGSHILRALARDNTGKRTISSGVAVRVSNPIRKRLHNQLTSSFTISGSGGKSFFTGQGSGLTDNASAATSTADPLQIGYAGVQMDTTPSSLSGFAILSGRVGGVLVGEASVPATPTMSSGRVYANINGPINTGIAFANPNSEDAVISFYFTDGSGNNFGQGSFTLGANQQISRFLNQNPFNGSTSMEGTFTFNASVPVGVTAIQGFINQRSEFLISLLPVASLGELNNNAVLLPHFTDGAGWTTQVVLTNPSDDPVNGRVQFFGTGSINQDATPLSLSVNGITNSIFNYGIAPRSAVRLVTGNSGSTVRTGSIRITPSIGNAPVAVEMFSYLDRGILVSQASILAASTGSTFRMYAETSGPVTQPLSIQSGVAIANPGQAPVTVDIALTQMDGSTVGQPTTVTIPANGQTARFVKELFPSSPNNFSGFITVTASSPIGVVGLRARYNERGDFLITPTPPRNDSDTVTDSEVVFPHVVSSGAGYSSQFVIFGQTGSGGIYFNYADGTPMPAASLRPVQ